MISFFKKKQIIDNLAWLGVDIHNHLLPEIDDGAKDLQQSLQLINSLKNLGLESFICTPHVYPDLYPNTPDTIADALSKLKSTAALPVENHRISAAAEYLVDDNFLPNNQLLCISDNYLLIEIPYASEVKNLEQIIFDLQIKGYKVILAHPERYLMYYKNHDRLSRLKDRDVLFQLNLLSVSGYYGKDVRLFAEFILSKKWYDFAGTDLHHQKHADELTKIVNSGYLYKSVGDYPFQNKLLL
ncbi:tyrosine-protein phosphatase [Pedobacter sp.]